MKVPGDASSTRVVVAGAQLRTILPQGKVLHLTVSLLVCSLCLGCVAVPVRAPTRTQGAYEAHGKIDLTFIQPGSTSREKVLEKLSWADTGLKDERLFLGRWTSSKWAVAWAVGGGYSAAGGVNRVWGAQNLMIEFDEKGVVKEYRIVPDQALTTELSAWLARSHKQDLDLSTPMEISIEDHQPSLQGGETYLPATLVLAKDYLELEEPEKRSREFRLSRRKLTQITFAGRFKRDEADPQYTNHTLHFAEKTRVGKKMTLRTDLPTLLVLLKYLGQSHTN